MKTLQLLRLPLAFLCGGLVAGAQFTPQLVPASDYVPMKFIQTVAPVFPQKVLALGLKSGEATVALSLIHISSSWPALSKKRPLPITNTKSSATIRSIVATSFALTAAWNSVSKDATVLASSAGEPDNAVPAKRQPVPSDFRILEVFFMVLIGG